MSIEGKIGRDGLNMSQEVGLYGSGMSGMPRPEKVRSTRRITRRQIRAAGTFIALAAVIVIVASAIGLSLPGLLRPSHQAVPGDSRDGSSLPVVIYAPPGPPLLMYGYLMTAGSVPVAGAYVTVTDLNTSVTLTYDPINEPGLLSDSSGFYSCQLADLNPGYVVGDIISVTATNATLSGTVTYTITGNEPGAFELDVTMIETGIPEFPMMAVPVLGMIGLVAVLRFARKGKEQ